MAGQLCLLNRGDERALKFIDGGLPGGYGVAAATYAELPTAHSAISEGGDIELAAVQSVGGGASRVVPLSVPTAVAGGEVPVADHLEAGGEVPVADHLVAGGEVPVADRLVAVGSARNFCGSCGTRLQEQNAMFCPGCGVQL
jgi:hypothetical protein